jgi:transposase-like protein
MNPESEISKLREAFHMAIVADIKEGVLSYVQIARKHGIGYSTVYNVARIYKCQRRAGKFTREVQDVR